MQVRFVEVAVRLVLVVAGIALGGAGGFLHLMRLDVAGVRLPLALVALLAVLLVLVWAGGLGGGRPAAALVAGGWLVATVALAFPGPGGDLVVTGTALSLAYLVGGMVVAAVGVGSSPELPRAVAGSLRRWRARRQSAESPEGGGEAAPGRDGSARSVRSAE